MSASVRIMLSFDYNHFEILKGTDRDLTDPEIDAMRKDVQRLALKAVRQYQKFKQFEVERGSRVQEQHQQEREAGRILAKAEADRSLNEMALLKAYQDRNWEQYIQERYDFEDEQDDYDDDDEPS